MFYWILFGFFAGFIAGVLDPYPTRGGVLSSVVLGVIGASVGGLLASMLFGSGLDKFSLTGFTLAIGLSIIMLLINHTVFADTKRI